MTCLFCFFAIVSFRFNFSLRYWFHGTRSWFSNICLTSHHVWVLLESHKPVSSALDHVGATGAMVRGYRGLDHGIMGHGVVGHLQFPVKCCKLSFQMSIFKNLWCLLCWGPVRVLASPVAATDGCPPLTLSSLKRMLKTSLETRCFEDIYIYTHIYI